MKQRIIESFKARKKYWLDNERPSFSDWWFSFARVLDPTFGEFIKLFFNIGLRLYPILLFSAFIIAAMNFASGGEAGVITEIALMWIMPSYLYAIVLLLSCFTLLWLISSLGLVNRISIWSSFRDAWSTVGLWTTAGFFIGVMVVVFDAMEVEKSYNYDFWSTVAFTPVVFTFLGMFFASFRLVSATSKNFPLSAISLVVIPMGVWFVHTLLVNMSAGDISPEGFFFSLQDNFVESIVGHYETLEGKEVSLAEREEFKNAISEAVGFSWLVPSIQIILFVDLLFQVIRDEIPKWRQK